MNRERIFIILVAVVVAAGAVWYQLRGPAHVTRPPPVISMAIDDSMTPKPVVHLTSAQEHARLMQLLHLSALRPGVGPVTANRDEAHANPYPNLPDPLKLDDGKPVTTPDIWWQQRRAEIADSLEATIYGKLQPLVSLAWSAPSQTADTIGGVAVKTLHVSGAISSTRSSLPPIRATAQLTVWLPDRAKGPVPIILLLKGPDRPGAPRSTWREQVLARGWGAAVLDVTSIQPDDGGKLTTAGAIGIAGGGQPRGPSDWGVLRAWAWGASRAIDCLESLPAVDATHIGIAGHSRYGKAALIAMAYDPRLAVAYISSSGAGGAAPLRRRFGEQIENLTGIGEFHWFAGNLLKYAGTLTPRDLPVDAHDLFAIAAPRPIFVSAGANGDDWVDPKGMFMAEAAATPVYKLLGKKGLASATMPPVETADDAGELAFRQHKEGHTMEPNWPSFLTFAARYLTPSKP